ncbi:MAG: heme-binding protein [Sphingopyxis sp.]
MVFDTIKGRHALGWTACLAMSLAGCGSGGTGGPGGGSPSPTPTPTPTGMAFVLPAAEALSVSDVERIIGQAVTEAQARGQNAVIAVVDRPGNVLGVFRMTGAPPTSVVGAAPNGQNRDAQGQTIPSTAAAIAKAVTGAYLSSGGNAFSTRTASMIVQQHFPPAPVAVGLESGPLYGVQFSSLPCSDLSARYRDGNLGTGPLIGPKRSPLGLSADAGGLPLYKNGVLVGGIGVMSDGVYGFDPDVTNIDNDPEEYSALAGTRGFEAPVEIRADRIPVDGTTLRYSDARYDQLTTSTAPAFATINGTLGQLIAVRGYFGAPVPVIQAGAIYGTEASGLRLATAAEFSRSDAMILSNGAGTGRYPIRGGTDAGTVATPMSAAETRAILEEAFTVMARARAQIRRPLNAQAQVTISVVDSFGAVLGMVRSPDAPLFGIDVSLQKARSAMFLSNSVAAANLLADPDPAVRTYVGAARTFLNDPAALTGTVAYSNRAIGLLHRPYFPDGEVGRANGPFSRDIGGFNPLSTGLQSAMTFPDILNHLLFVLNINSADVKQRCTNIPDSAPGLNRLANGMQIFPGAVPIYRGNQLVGGIGISGDGIDQDDMVAFLGVANASARLGGSVTQAPFDRRADRLVVTLPDARQVRLRYVNCPFTPFLDTDAQNVCQGL